MTPLERYRSLLPERARESASPTPARRWTEMELQAHWFAGDFGRDFRSTTGLPVRVVQFGTWNHEAGPDFADAAVTVGDEPARLGAIEFDPDARDWERHGHGGNPAYNGTVLHVYPEHGGPEFFTRTAQHRAVPQVKLDLAVLAGDPPNPLPAARLGRCAAPLQALSEARVREVLLGAAHFRLQRKAAVLARSRDLHGADEALYQALATALGYKSNKLPFTLLAQRLPLKRLRDNRDDIDALLFGLSGFLPGTDLAQFADPARDYLRTIWQRWWARRDEFSRLVLSPGDWRLGGQRPANHPQRRVAALAQLVRHWPGVRAFWDSPSICKVRAFMTGLTDPFWDHHYTLDSARAPKRLALIGTSRVVDILANVFLPLASLDHPEAIAAYDELGAPLSNQRVEIAALRLFGTSPVARTLLKRAAMQQGLLQVYEDFCLQDATDCAQCRFPHQLDAW